MAKRSRRPVRGESSASDRLATTSREVRTGAPEDRNVRRSRSRRARQQGPLERYRSWIITGAAAAGVLIIGWVFFQGAATAAYSCSTQITPGPVESVTPRPPPTPTPTPSPTPTPTPIATPGPSSTAAASGSPAASSSPAPSGSPVATGSPAASGSPTPAPTPEPDPTPRLGFTTTILGRGHVPANQPINYAYCPPTSGDHYNLPVAPIPARFYGANEEKTPALWLHNLEHGFVVVAYRCPSGTPGTGDCPSTAEMAQLQAFFDQAPASAVAACPKKVTVVRFDDMSTKFAMLAWGRALLTDQFDLDTALTFTEQWMDHEATPERGAC